ncbi:MAG: hypothetical protein AAF558_12285 [Verrucomicrobiota bacterium]
MKKYHLLFAGLIAISMTACSKISPLSEKEAVIESPEYKSLLRASSGTYFERKLPDGLKDTDWVYAAIAYPNGEKKDILGVSEQGVEFTSDTVKVYFFEEKFGGLPFVAMQINENTMGQGATEHASEEKWKARVKGKKIGEFSDPMIRFSTQNSISPIGGAKIPEGCFDLILYIDHDQPKS